MTSWTSMATSPLVIELGNTSPSRESLCETRMINATGSHQGKGIGEPLWCPWWALGAPTTVMWLWYRRDPRDTKGLEPARPGQWGSPHAWSLLCQLPVSRSVESCCVIPVHGKDVTVEDGTDIPAELPAFNPAGRSGPVDRGLPSATSSLRVRARTLS